MMQTYRLDTNICIKNIHPDVMQTSWSGTYAVKMQKIWRWDATNESRQDNNHHGEVYMQTRCQHQGDAQVDKTTNIIENCMQRKDESILKHNMKKQELNMEIYI